MQPKCQGISIGRLTSEEGLDEDGGACLGVFQHERGRGVGLLLLLQQRPCTRPATNGQTMRRFSQRTMSDPDNSRNFSERH